MPLNWCCEEAAAYLAGVNTRRANKRQLEMKYRNSKCLVDCGRNSLRDQFASGCSHHCSDSGRTVGAVGIGEGTRKAAGIVARHGERIVHINKPGLTEEVARPIIAAPPYTQVVLEKLTGLPETSVRVPLISAKPINPFNVVRTCDKVGPAPI